jgi:hypothetical protein
VSADDITVTKAQPPVATTKASTSTPAACSSLWDFVGTSCLLYWYGITIYGVVDMGVTWQSHAAPFNPTSIVGEDYLIQTDWIRYFNRRYPSTTDSNFDDGFERIPARAFAPTLSRISSVFGSTATSMTGVRPGCLLNMARRRGPLAHRLRLVLQDEPSRRDHSQRPPGRFAPPRGKQRGTRRRFPSLTSRVWKRWTTSAAKHRHDILERGHRHHGAKDFGGTWPAPSRRL